MISAKELRMSQVSPDRTTALTLIDAYIEPRVWAKADSDPTARSVEIVICGRTEVHYEVKRILESDDLGFSVKLVMSKPQGNEAYVRCTYFIIWG